MTDTFDKANAEECQHRFTELFLEQLASVNPAFPHTEADGLKFIIQHGEGKRAWFVHLDNFELLRLFSSAAWGMVSGGAGSKVAVIIGMVWALVEFKALRLSAQTISGKHAQVLLVFFEKGVPLDVDEIAQDVSRATSEVRGICEEMWGWGILGESKGQYFVRDLRLQLRV